MKESVLAHCIFDKQCAIRHQYFLEFIAANKQLAGFSFEPTLMLHLQVENMTNKHHIYMTKDGRISLAGLPSSKAEYLAKAIDDSVRNVNSKL